MKSFWVVYLLLKNCLAVWISEVIMTSNEFVYWLQGWLEISGKTQALSVEQVQIIRDHLQLVFKKETPSYEAPNAFIHNDFNLKCNDFNTTTKFCSNDLGQMDETELPQKVLLSKKILTDWLDEHPPDAAESIEAFKEINVFGEPTC